MQETNPGAEAPKSEQPAQPKPVEAKPKAFADVPILPKSMRPVEASKSTTALPKVISEHLGETDLQIKLSMEMNGRTVVFPVVQVTKVVYDGMSKHSRGLLHVALTTILEEMKSAASLRLNLQLGYDADSPKGKEKNGGASGPKGDIPPYTGAEEPDIDLHTPPGIDPGMSN